MFEQSCTWKFTAPLFIIAENWKQFSCPSTGKWLTNSRTFLPWNAAAAAAAKSLQSCSTLCDPIDGSPPGSPVPGILQARTLEWVAISFSNAWKWKVKVRSLSRIRLFATPWTAAYQAPLSMGFSRQEYWSGLPLPSPPWNATQPLKRTIIDTCNNLEESPENHTEWKTQSPKGYMLYDSIYITFLRWQYVKEEQIGSCQESRRGCGQEGRESSYKKATWGILAVMGMLTVSIS